MTGYLSFLVYADALELLKLTRVHFFILLLSDVIGSFSIGNLHIRSTWTTFSESDCEHESKGLNQAWRCKFVEVILDAMLSSID